MQQLIEIDGKTLAVYRLGLPFNVNTTQIILGHGWGQSHKIFLPFADFLKLVTSTLLIDFPGFGDSPHISDWWGTQEYSDFIAAWVKTLPPCKKRIWVGFSFGARIGIQLAANYPDLFQGLFLVAAPGLPSRRSLFKQIIIQSKIASYKILKHIIPPRYHDWLKNKFGSSDYKNAGILRSVLVKVISEDLTDVAKKIKCPVHLIYGANETDVDLAVGKTYKKIIPNATLTVLPRYTHHDILSNGKDRLMQLLNKFIEL